MDERAGQRVRERLAASAGDPVSRSPLAEREAREMGLEGDSRRVAVVRRRRRRRRSRLGRRAIAIALGVLLLVCLGLAARHALDIVDQAKAARASLHALVAAASGVDPELDRARLTQLTAEFDRVRADLDTLAVTMRGDPLVAVLRHVPGIDRQIAGADHLVAAGEDLVGAADALLPTAQGYVAARERHVADPTHDSQLADLANLMAQSAAAAADAQALVADARVELAAVPIDLIGQIEDARSLVATELGKYGPFLDAYVQASRILPGVLGVGGEKRYLVLAEDSPELRPTGGFIGTYGIMAFDGGRIVQKVFQDVYLLDGRPGLPFVTPPGPLVRHLVGWRPWRLRDSNWAADFPTTAQDALRLYTSESGDRHVDGVVAMTTGGMDSLLQVTGSITVPEYGVTVQPGETAVTLLQHTRTAPASGVNRKVFVADFADEVMTRLLETPPSKWPALIGVLGTMGRQRQALVWLRDPGAQAVVTQYGWDGAVRHDPGDYLYVVDSSVNPGSKLFAVTTRSEVLAVELHQDGTASETLQVAWDNHFGGDGGILKGVQPLDSPNLGDYVRLLLPQGSTVMGPTGDRSWPVSWAGVPETVTTTESGRLAWGHYQQVPPGTTTLTYRWTTPIVVTAEGGRDRYRLVIQKQPGTPSDSIIVRITLPPGATLVSSSPGLTVSGSTLTLTTVMDGDQVVDLSYTLAPALGG